MTWGNAYCGGDSSAVQDQLQHVQQIQSTRFAFAAILADGSVLAWGADFASPARPLVTAAGEVDFKRPFACAWTYSERQTLNPKP